MRNVLLTLSLLILSATIVLAQRTVTGTVTSAEDGESVPGVNVVLKGTTTGTVTNIDGDYSLDVPSDGGTLVFSFIGFASQEIQIGNQNTINVTMAADVTQLGEVIVVGYGTTLKKEFTGSSASVSGEEITRMPIMSANQAIQGQAAGVFVGANSGTPGGGITVRVRGSTSIAASNDPLYIIDGVPVVSGDLSIEGFGGQETSALSALNPQDIASIEVLKDASSTAIYGARAANGVVIITTKRGKKSGGLDVSYNGYVGWSEATNVNDILTAQEWVDIMNEARTNDGLTPRTNAEWGWDGTTSTDWIKEVFRTGFLQEHQLSASGGGEKTRYYMSGSFRAEEGAMLGSDIERSTFRVNLDHNATEKLTLGTSISYSHQLNNRIQNDNNIGGILSASLLGQPILPVYTDETKTEYALGGFGGFLANPVQQALVPRYDDT
ncbi:MAG: SusC/RagA family TonB-linked outer membrane protein, partial [Saprospiraceae bacterium]|nr:SusC/RagA family TonB-linked outer membrane protein [Saprospiraceae bacterium]